MSHLIRRNFQLLYRLRDFNYLVKQKRFSHGDYWGYREPNHNVNYGGMYIWTRAVATFFWWWVIYHLYHEPERIYGHFPYHNAWTEWTDEELGIPLDEEGLAPTIENPRTTRIPGVNPRHRNISPHTLKWRYNDEGLFKF